MFSKFLRVIFPSVCSGSLRLTAFCRSPTSSSSLLRCSDVVVVVVRSRLIMFFVCPYAYQEPKGRRLPYVPMCVCACGMCVIIVSDLMRTLMWNMANLAFYVLGGAAQFDSLCPDCCCFWPWMRSLFLPYLKPH